MMQRNGYEFLEIDAGNPIFLFKVGERVQDVVHKREGTVWNCRVRKGNGSAIARLGEMIHYDVVGDDGYRFAEKEKNLRRVV